MLVAALCLNIVILGPVILGLLSGGMDAAFGPDTDARRILTCVYIAIAAVSLGLIGLHVIGHRWAVPMTLALFSVQITYKAATALLVGLSSPVVATNLLVVAVQIGAIVAWSVARG
ncbi:hypothetical protein [Tateyamaria sp. ANG-S1]|uniref:hypothetical protein n=1 Tax=Tateyamaria sp. ANG-S1 TaxID=1577905 RepID=UPI00057FBE43|nr:hypothetical protein [Tateyamaria sp. ANG-S1]KIC51880.1 hypothetical protein RA29_00845 [Tateyamaria sp. ANG-S1]